MVRDQWQYAGLDVYDLRLPGRNHRNLEYKMAGVQYHRSILAGQPPGIAGVHGPGPDRHHGYCHRQSLRATAPCNIDRPGNRYFNSVRSESGGLPQGYCCWYLPAPLFRARVYWQNLFQCPGGFIPGNHIKCTPPPRQYHGSIRSCKRCGKRKRNPKCGHFNWGKQSDNSEYAYQQNGYIFDGGISRCLPDYCGGCRVFSD